MPSRTIVFVEDDEDARRAFAMLLESEGYAVLEAANGLEAIELLRRLAEPPCVILLDMIMPVMDGMGFRSLQLADARLARIPTIFLSAAGQLVPDAPGVLVVSKPPDIEALLDIVKRICA